MRPQTTSLIQAIFGVRSIYMLVALSFAAIVAEVLYVYLRNMILSIAALPLSAIIIFVLLQELGPSFDND